MKTEEPLSESFQPSLAAVIEHWSRIRIDSPLDLLSRYDNAAKELIALAIALQGLYLAVLAFSDLGKSLPEWVGLSALVFLVPAYLCAFLCISTVPETMEAMKALRLVSGLARGLRDLDSLNDEMHDWCRRLDALVLRKRKWLRWANLAFLLAAAIVVAVIFWGMTLSRGAT